jgi:hypothetical protein
VGLHGIYSYVLKRIIIYELPLFEKVVLRGIFVRKGEKVPIPVAERSKAWVCSCSPAEIAGSNPAGGMDVCLL